jgi:hypothetical protein
MIDCMDKRLRDTSKSYLLAYLDPTKTEWLDRHMPSMLYCLHRHASVPSPLHVNFNFPSSHYFIYCCGSYILSRVPHLTISTPNLCCLPMFSFVGPFLD